MADRSELSLAGAVDEQQQPQIAAAFLVTFDNRKGYTITWQKSLDDSKLDGSVEFKCLPSGLHKIEEDLVYFTQDKFAGISAFLRKADTEEHRNARMLSVGALVPVGSGRLGKSFLLAEELKELAQVLIDDQATVAPLETFWDKHRIRTEDDHEREHDGDKDDDDAGEYQKLRSLSAVSLTTPAIGRQFSPHHPALALSDLLKTFGPLIFPLCRASLLRKRILLVGEAPVGLMCNFVYCLSVLSTISRGDAAHIPYLQATSYHSRPLFNIGISDITSLESMSDPWIACTTDDVLASKPHLFDVLIIMPTASVGSKFASKTYPKIIMSTPELQKQFPKHGVRATQRDAKRFAALHTALRKLPSTTTSSTSVSPEMGARDDDDDASSTSSVSTVPDDREVVEPMPWSVIAYTSLVWWASAGDSRSGLLEAEELSNEQDDELLRDSFSRESATKEIAVVAYFHKLVSLILRVLIRAVERFEQHYRDDHADSQSDEQRLLNESDSEIVVDITEDDIREMGLDIWSATDRQFVQEAVNTYWHRATAVRGGVIECCGIRIL